jgi:hypothetical protein
VQRKSGKCVSDTLAKTFELGFAFSNRQFQCFNWFTQRCVSHLFLGVMISCCDFCPLLLSDLQREDWMKKSGAIRSSFCFLVSDIWFKQESTFIE